MKSKTELLAEIPLFGSVFVLLFCYFSLSIGGRSLLDPFNSSSLTIHGNVLPGSSNVILIILGGSVLSSIYFSKLCSRLCFVFLNRFRTFLFQAKNNIEASILLMTAVGRVKLESGNLDEVKVRYC